MDRIVVGTKEAVESEYGATGLFGKPFVILIMWNDETVAIEEFNTMEGVKRSLEEIEDRTTIEWL